MPPEPKPGTSSLARALGPTGLLGLAWTAAPAICGTLLLASLGPVSEWPQGCPPPSSASRVAACSA